MQIRCLNCHKPFSLSKETILGALEKVESEHLTHFDAHCPHCRRVNRISRQELMRAAPDWKGLIKEN
jgi:phage FluMu protein Com